MAALICRARPTVLLCLLVLLCHQQQAHCTVFSVAPERVEGTGLLYTHMVERGPAFKPRFIWSPVRVLLNCSSPAFSVLTASTLDKLASDTGATKVLWCGWRNIMSEPNTCELRFSMFQSTYFAVKPAQPGLLSLGQPELSCSVTVPDHIDRDIRLGFVLTVAAVALFVQAGRLAQSQAFRLTTGGLMGVTGAAAIVLIVLMRNAPAKRAIGVGWAISASGMWGIVRWAFGTWAPGIQAVVFSRVGVWYVIVTGTAGVAIAFWMDDPANHKINTTIRVALQILGLGMLYCAIADEYVALGALALLMCYGWLWTILRYLFFVARSVAWFLRWLQFKLGSGPARPTGGAADAQLEFPLGYDEPSYHSSEDEDYSPPGSSDGDEASGGLDTEGLEDDSGEGSEEQGQAAASQPQPAAGGVQAAAAGPSGAASRWAWLGFRRSGGAAAVPGRELEPAPSFDEWTRPQRPAAAAPAAQPSSLAGAGSSGDAAAPGSSWGGWGSTLVPMANHQQQQQPEAQRPRSTSPWHETGKVVDFTQPKPRSPPAGPATAAAGAGSSRPSAAAVGASRTPGGGSKVVNPETGREISTTGGTFKELLARGYEYNAATNTLQLSALGSPAAAAAAAGNVRGAPTPASNLRSRRSSKVQ